MNILREYIRSILRETFQSHTFEPMEGDAIININDNCKHQGSEGIVLSVGELPDDQGKVVEYECTNAGPTWSIGDILKKTMDQLAPAPAPAGKAYSVRRN